MTIKQDPFVNTEPRLARALKLAKLTIKDSIVIEFEKEFAQQISYEIDREIMKELLKASNEASSV
jgi:hypothetical protein